MAKFIIHRKITPDLLVEMDKYAPTETFKKSITDGARNDVGTLAEICYALLLVELYDVNSVRWVSDNNRDYDFKVDGHATFDLKTKLRSLPPRPTFAASVAAYQNQDCQTYAFAQITGDPEKPKGEQYTDFYYMGDIAQDLFYQKAEFKKKGDKDGNNVKRNGQPFLIVEDCYNLDYRHLQFPNEKRLERILSGNRHYKKLPW